MNQYLKKKKEFVESIVYMLNNHSDKIDICKDGCDMLRNVTVNRKMNSKLTYSNPLTFEFIAEYKVFGLEARGIEAVSKVMRINMNIITVCESVCGALYSLSVDGKQEKMFLSTPFIFNFSFFFLKPILNWLQIRPPR